MPENPIEYFHTTYHFCIGICILVVSQHINHHCNRAGRRIHLCQFHNVFQRNQQDRNTEEYDLQKRQFELKFINSAIHSLVWQILTFDIPMGTQSPPFIQEFSVQTTFWHSSRPAAPGPLVLVLEGHSKHTVCPRRDW